MPEVLGVRLSKPTDLSLNFGGVSGTGWAPLQSLELQLLELVIERVRFREGRILFCRPGRM